MPDLTVNTLPANGAAPAAATPFETPDAGGDRFQNTSRTLIFVKQAGGASGDVNLVSVANEDGRTGDQLVTNAASTLKVAGFLRRRAWNVGNFVATTYPSGIVGVTVSVVEVPRA